ncbi:hypothetical protein ACNKHQ_19780 [Shigella flexneri]
MGKTRPYGTLLKVFLTVILAGPVHARCLKKYRQANPWKVCTTQNLHLM